MYLHIIYVYLFIYNDQCELFNLLALHFKFYKSIVLKS